MMPLWPSWLAPKEIFSRCFRFNHSGHPPCCVNLLAPTHDSINSITLKMDTYSGSKREPRTAACAREGKTKKHTFTPVISFIWSRFENNSPVHLSLSDRIICKWSLQNINSISITKACSKTHRGLNDHIITSEGPLVAFKYFQSEAIKTRAAHANPFNFIL